VGERLRGRAGQRARLRRLRRTNGLCEHCLKARRTRAAVEVDHITPLALGGEDVDGNTRNLCRPCHLAATAKQFGHEAPIGARGIGASGRPTSADHAWSGPAPAMTPPGGRKSPTPVHRTPSLPSMRCASVSGPKSSADLKEG